MKFFGNAEYPLPCLRADAGILAVHYLGNGGNRYTGHLCNVFYRHKTLLKCVVNRVIFIITEIEYETC